MSNEAPTDALRLVPISALPDEIDLFRILRAAGRSNREKAFAVSNHLQALAPAPASPLPGGGDWSAIRNAFVRHAEAFVKASRYEEASAIADKAAREIQDLRSPLPAAPTGEPK